jgi:hypothetical protein
MMLFDVVGGCWWVVGRPLPVSNQVIWRYDKRRAAAIDGGPPITNRRGKIAQRL